MKVNAENLLVSKKNYMCYYGEFIIQKSNLIKDWHWIIKFLIYARRRIVKLMHLQNNTIHRFVTKVLSYSTIVLSHKCVIFEKKINKLYECSRTTYHDN